MSWSPRLAEKGRALNERLRDCDPEALRAAVEAESQRRLKDFADGVARYRAFPRPERPTEPPVIWRGGATRLLDYGAGTGGRPVLFVPSLINRGYILDLVERRSLMRHLAARGLRPLLVDWGAPGEREADFTLEDYIAGRLTKMLNAACRLEGGPVGLAGYCMGGTLALALAALRPEQVSALVLMATPWDFHAVAAAKRKTLAAMMPAFRRMLDTTASMPTDVLQAMFTSLDPQLTAAKFRAFAALNPRTVRAAHFVALEDWLNDGVPLAGPTALECLEGWYVENLPGRGRWRVGGRLIEPGAVTAPALVVAPMRDHIVPPASALPLADQLPNCKCLRIKAGHIGMVAGSRARGSLYTPLTKWLQGAP